MMLKTCSKNFLIPASVLGSKFRGKLLDHINKCYKVGKLSFSTSCEKLRNSYHWNELKDSLSKKTWCPDIRETFNGFGNAIEYLGRYTHRIAITNSRIQMVTEDTVTFTAKDYKNNSAIKEVTLTNKEFIRRLLMHVLPSGFQKIRYYGFLNNRNKQKNLKIIFKIQGHQKFKAIFTGLSMAEILKLVWSYDVHTCPECGCSNMKHAGRTYALRN